MGRRGLLQNATGEIEFFVENSHPQENCGQKDFNQLGLGYGPCRRHRFGSHSVRISPLVPDLGSVLIGRVWDVRKFLLLAQYHQGTRKIWFRGECPTWSGVQIISGRRNLDERSREYDRILQGTRQNRRSNDRGWLFTHR